MYSVETYILLENIPLCNITKRIIGVLEKHLLRGPHFQLGWRLQPPVLLIHDALFIYPVFIYSIYSYGSLTPEITLFIMGSDHLKVLWKNVQSATKFHTFTFAAFMCLCSGYLRNMGVCFFDKIADTQQAALPGSRSASINH